MNISYPLQKGCKYHHELFYDYLTGEVPLPDSLFIGKDCVNLHGKEGKTVRIVTKHKWGTCLKCYQASNLRKAERKSPLKEKEAVKKHSEAMHPQERAEEEYLVDRLFLIN